MPRVLEPAVRASGQFRQVGVGVRGVLVNCGVSGYFRRLVKVPRVLEPAVRVSGQLRQVGRVFKSAWASREVLWAISCEGACG